MFKRTYTKTRCFSMVFNTFSNRARIRNVELHGAAAQNDVTHHSPTEQQQKYTKRHIDTIAPRTTVFSHFAAEGYRKKQVGRQNLGPNPYVHNMSNMECMLHVFFLTVLTTLTCFAA